MSRSIARMSLAAALALPVALGAVAVQAKPPAAAGVRLHATLSGAKEIGVNGQTGAGAPGGTGTFSARLVPGRGQLCYTLMVAGIGAVTMAHIHTGAAGVNGGVFVALPDLTPGQHCIAIDRAKATALVARPGAYYANIHTAAFPNGAVRGQLMKH